MPRILPALVLVVTLAGAASCVDPIDLAGRACPCAHGFTCEATTQRCVALLPDAAVDPCAGTIEPLAGAITARCVAGASPTVDGDLADWPDGSLGNRLDHATAARAGGTWGTDETANDANCSAMIGLAWDTSYLYVAARVRDDKRIILASLPPYESDDFELFLAGGDRSGPYDATDHQLVFRADGKDWGEYRAGTRSALPVGVLFAVGPLPAPAPATDWAIEIAVPWALLGDAGSLGRVLGIDTVLEDVDSTDGTSSRDLVWMQRDTGPCAACGGAACLPYCSTTTFAPLQLGTR